MKRIVIDYIAAFRNEFIRKSRLGYSERMAAAFLYADRKQPAGAQALRAYYAAGELSTISATRGTETDETKIGRAIALAMNKIPELERALRERDGRPTLS